MKRFLSWIVLYVLNFVFYILVFYIWKLAVDLFTWLYASSKAIFWVALFLGGGELLLALIYFALIFGGRLVVRASQATCRSENGTRYKVIGILNIITYIVFIVLVVIGGSSAKLTIVNVLAHITMIIFGIIMIAARNNIASGESLSK